MVKNRAHFIESFEDRLNRFQNNPPIEVIDTLLLSIQNFFNNEIKHASKNNQTSLLFLGIHAAALTVSEFFWGLEPKKGYKKFLKEFVDGDTEDTRFSKVSNEIHNWRNVLAHQWLASSGYRIQYDYEMNFGFKTENGIIIINPKIYCEKYIEAFDENDRIFNYVNSLDEEKLENIKKRIIKKFLEK